MEDALRLLLLTFRITYDAFQAFLEDDGWAIASHIALSILMSLFPFLIFVTALAGFLVRFGRTCRTGGGPVAGGLAP